MQETQEVELFPCPFCGDAASLLDAYPMNNRFFLRCDKCWIQTTLYKNKIDAINMWNKRTKDGSNDKCNNEHTDGAIT